MSYKSDFIVVGSAIVVLATAYKLHLKFPDQSILIWEKEPKIGLHQTGRNSGVMHSGIYYKPGSYKAKNCKIGSAQLIKFAIENNIKHDVCGKVIVASSKEELPVLEDIYQRGIQNETPGICYLTSEEIKQKEPFIEGIKGIWVPTAGIIDYVAVCEAFVDQITAINVESKLIKSCEVLEVMAESNSTTLKKSQGNFMADQIFFWTRLQFDRIAEKDALKLA